MAVPLEELEAQALKLPIRERSELIHRLIVSIDGEPEGTSEESAKAWEEEIARRVAEMDAGRKKWNSAKEVMTELRTRIKTAEAGRRTRTYAASAPAINFQRWARPVHAARAYCRCGHSRIPGLSNSCPTDPCHRHRPPQPPPGVLGGAAVICITHNQGSISSTPAGNRSLWIETA